MSQNLKLRILTAIVGVAVILTLLLWLGVGGVAFFAFVISTGMLFEFSKMFFTLEDAKTKTALLILFNAFAHGLNYWLVVGVSSAFLGLAPAYLFFILFLFMVPKLLQYGGANALNSESGIKILSAHVHELMALVFGWIYLGWFPLLMVTIRSHAEGKHWLLLTLITVWSSDTFAYFAGRARGKTLLYETVSPKKTWEGAVGGTLGALILGIVYAHFYLPEQSKVTVGVIVLAMSVASALGDLCESLIKRASNVKDSGNLLPGHGGVLDRFDGVVFALPVMCAYLWLISP
jgi:phosphatidate cytidylyltransferase